MRLRLEAHARSLVLGSLGLICATLTPGTAAAQDAGEPPRRTRTFVEAGVGAGWFHVGAGSDEDERAIRGVSLSTELALGGKVSQRVALGAAYVRDDAFALSATDELIDGDEVTLDGVSMTYGMLAFFVDWHPLADDGLHLRAALGIGTLGIDYPLPEQAGGGSVDESDRFIGWSLGCGYHRRVAGAFSLGVLARLSLASFTHRGNSASDVLVATPALLFTLGAH